MKYFKKSILIWHLFKNYLYFCKKLKIKYMIPLSLTINGKLSSAKAEDKVDVQNHYNPEFVDKIRRSEQSKGVRIKTEDLWK